MILDQRWMSMEEIWTKNGQG